jgi:hypothetical protein
VAQWQDKRTKIAQSVEALADTFLSAMRTGRNNSKKTQIIVLKLNS